MSKTKLKNLINYSAIFFIPLFILLICILNTFVGNGNVEHIYTSVSFNVETGFQSFGNIISCLDILNVRTLLISLVDAINSSFNVTIYLQVFFSWLGWFLSYEIVTLCFDLMTFILRWCKSKVGGAL